MAGWSFYPASTLPAPYDIVWCAFPEGLEFDVPGPKMRPALILQTGLSDPGFCPEVRVVYGTSKLKKDKRRHDLFVENYQDKYDAGLFQATRFDLERIILLPWATDWFVSPGPHYPTPVMGSLPEHIRRVLGFLLIEQKRRRDFDEC
jgi:hypothetical protein